MRGLPRALVVIGVILLLPAACSVATGTLNEDIDAAVAFTPVARLSLDGLHGGQPVDVLFRVPNSPQWDRIRLQ